MEKGFQIDVLGNSFVRYIDHLGDDIRIVEAARISYKSPSKGIEADKKLLKYLINNLHTSPLEQVNITFNIRMPIFVMRQFVRHRTMRLNEASFRYTEADMGYYIPEKWRKQDTKNKQSSIETSELNHDDLSAKLLDHCTKSHELYKSMIDEGVARELARMVLPVNALTEIYVNCDLNNLLKYFRLRDDSHAQWEHQEIARAMKEITRQAFPYVMEIYDEKIKELK